MSFGKRSDAELSTTNAYARLLGNYGRPAFPNVPT